MFDRAQYAAKTFRAVTINVSVIGGLLLGYVVVSLAALVVGHDSLFRSDLFQFALRTVPICGGLLLMTQIARRIVLKAVSPKEEKKRSTVIR
ncbi:MAG: hypothetical protein EBR82_26310 [Caulobacteraceae bacterium]|nr:hypothetical protein [Caulobacteraceae bacterium]